MLSAPGTPALQMSQSPFEIDVEKNQSEDDSRGRGRSADTAPARPGIVRYTTGLRQAPRQTFVQQLKLFNGRLHQDNWFRVAVRPFILFSYPAVLWSSVVYACSVGWLIVLSESVAVIYRTRDTYNFSALSAGLVYLSPFIGGVLGTAVAGKVSDIVVRAMSRRNGGLYEPEFRLVMAAPVALTTVIGLMGFGWSAQEHDRWIVPTVFFGIISFGCSLGSTTAITFCVDSYRQYAGEALVTLNFSKEHPARPGVQPLLHLVARVRRLQDGLHLGRRHPADPHGLHRAHVHLREARTHAHCQVEPDGEVLNLFCFCLSSVEPCPFVSLTSRAAI